MTTFTESATSFISSRPDSGPRGRAWFGFTSIGLPTTADEVWRYAPLSDLDLDRYLVPATPTLAPSSDFAVSLSALAASVVRVVDGFLVDIGEPITGVTVDVDTAQSTLGGEDPLERYANDAFALANAALCPATVVVTVSAGTVVDGPIVIVHSANASASLPRTHLILERGANATVVEYYEGGDEAIVVPVSEYRVAENASLQLVTYQRLAPTTWHVARTTGLLERDARLSQAVLGMGAHYDRSRNDAELRSSGAENELRTTFFGSGAQVHDFRTHQFHRAPRTRSTLLSKGAVADTSRSVYTGLIEIEKGAKRTDARQTNHNLLLSANAHADSVPNLDIRENDVVCAHASSVGPLDALQRWYLESRGVTRSDAERLMIQGFFLEMLDALPKSLARLVEGDVSLALASVPVRA